MERRLTTILAADVVGYSAMMGADEEATLAALKRCRSDLLEPQVAARGGRIFKLTGDGILAEFPSVLGAVECALEIQQALRAGGAGAQADRPIALRIGINLGDVMIDDGDLYGDGVNVAARLEGIALAGGIAVSQTVREHVGERSGARFRDRGEQTLKNIARPVRVYDVLIGEDEGIGGAPASVPLCPGGGTGVLVLPFRNMSGEPDQDYIADGLTEDLITELSQLAGLRVVGRTTSFSLKGKAQDAALLAGQLNISHLVEGSVRQAGGKLRITGELIDAASGDQLWAQRFDRELADVFDIQDEISKAIAGALTSRLSDKAGTSTRETRNPRAYDLYLRARHSWNQASEDSLQRSVRLFQQAIAEEPAYARAHAGLADAFVALGMQTYMDPKLAYGRARAAAEKALSYDNRLADAYASLGLVAFVHDWDRQTAERHLCRAVELDPSSVTARHHYSRVLSSRGKHPEAIAEAAEATRIEPLSAAAAVQLASAKNNAGRHAEAISILERVDEMFPHQFRTFYGLTFAHAYQGDAAAAVTSAERAVQCGGRTPFALGALGYAKAVAGSPDEALAIVAELEQAAATQYVCPYDLAAIHAALGNSDSALEWLEKAVAVRDHAMLFAEVDPALRPIHRDPRFASIAAQVAPID